MLTCTALAGVSEADVHLQLAEEDNRAVEAREVSPHKVTPGTMLVEMLDIENTQ